MRFQKFHRVSRIKILCSSCLTFTQNHGIKHKAQPLFPPTDINTFKTWKE